MKRERGFSLVEIIVASAIISLALLSVIVAAGRSLALSHRALDTYVAGTLLEEGAEAVRVVRDNAWTNISGLTAGTTYYPTFSGGTWTLSTSASTVGIYTRTVVITAVSRDNTTQDIVSSGGTADTGTKKVTVTVSWNESGSSLSKTLQFYIANIFN